MIVTMDQILVSCLCFLDEALNYSVWSSWPSWPSVHPEATSRITSFIQLRINQVGWGERVGQLGESALRRSLLISPHSPLPIWHRDWFVVN